MRFTVRAPASSANLGPGFDALALALDLWNEIAIEPATGETRVVLAGNDAELLVDRENLSLTAMRFVASRYQRELPPVTITVQADVPVARGLGSSAAAVVAGLFAANHLLALGLTDGELYAHAWSMEGHGDNVGAAVYGGAILAVPGIQEAIQLTNGDGLGLAAAVFIPKATGATWAARAALPGTIPFPDAAFNVATSSGLVAGLLTKNMAAISAGMRDRLHEPYRSRLFPHLTPMAEAARNAGAVGACLSGAGPTILALARPEDASAICEALSGIAERLGVPGQAAVLNIAPTGVEVIER
ncbi:MAG: homoserine kinase [Thermomicrobiales bacterium]